MIVCVGPAILEEREMIINSLEIIAFKCSSVCKWARVGLSFFLQVGATVVLVMFWGGVTLGSDGIQFNSIIHRLFEFLLGLAAER